MQVSEFLDLADPKLVHALLHEQVFFQSPQDGRVALQSSTFATTVRKTYCEGMYKVAVTAIIHILAVFEVTPPSSSHLMGRELSQKR